MSEQPSLESVYNHPLVTELIHENTQLRTLSERPEVDDLKEVPLPYTIQQHLVIKEGVHNGTTYTAQILRMSVDQHEGLQIYEDHKDSKGAGVQTWVGAMHNPTWSESDKAILADIDIVDPKYAMAIAYGAKFGLSATVEVDTREVGNKQIASNPQFVSYSLVIDPAVRETMLNERENSKEESKEMSEENLDDKSDIKSIIAKVEDAIGRASAMKDTSLLISLQQIKAMLGKLVGTSYPYPKPGSPAKLDEIEAKLAALEQVVASIQSPPEPSGNPPNAELEAALKENEQMKEQLEAIKKKELAAQVDSIITKESNVGLLSATDTDNRRKELETMEESALTAIEHNLDKTISILESQPEDVKPEVHIDSTATKELSSSRASSERLLQMMVKEQNKGHMKYGDEVK